jgi:RNA-directed DNA polymerase
MAKGTGLEAYYLDKIVRSASHRYKIYKIAKKTGGKREIAHPAAELKLLQRWLVDNVFSHLPIHESVYSYRQGRGIRDLATLHKKNNFLLKIDFVDFFPSIKADDIAYLLRSKSNLVPLSLSSQDLLTIQAIVCKDGCLTIGSPSSPIITNSLLYDFDSRWFEKALKTGVIYSRYADDIYFSTNKPKILEDIYDDFKKDLDKLKHPRLVINEKKTVFTSKKRKRIVTGLILSSDNKVSIGRQKKRYIKGMINRFIHNELKDKEISYLKGFLAYVNGIEKMFMQNLKRKFGNKHISAIMKSETVSIKNKSSKLKKRK